MSRFTTTIVCALCFFLGGRFAIASESLKLTRSYVWSKYIPNEAGSGPTQLPGRPAAQIEVIIDQYGTGTWSESATLDGISFIIQIDVRVDHVAGGYNVGVSIYNVNGFFSESEATVSFHLKTLSDIPTFDLQPSMLKKASFGIRPVVSFTPTIH